MAYSVVNASELLVNKPLTSSLMTRVNDNPLAIFAQLGWAVTGSVATSAEQAITISGTVTFNHGLTSISNGYDVDVSLYLICKTAEGGYSIGDVVPISVSGQGSSASSGISTIVSATSVILRFGASTINISTASTGTAFSITVGNWKIITKVRG